MEISSDFVGTPLREHVAEITWRDMMNYAAAIDDPNPRYLDDERPDGVMAHPMFSVAVTWRTLGRIWEFIEDQDFPVHLLATQVHYTEHLRFHRPLKSGQALTIRGEIAAILPHKSGTLVVIRSDALAEDGSPVFTEHAGTLLRGVVCLDGGQGGDKLPVAPASPAETEPLWKAVIPIEPLRPYLYDGCTGISFPIHISRQFAHQVGLPDIILQGTATLALAVRELVNRELEGDPRQLVSLHGRFTGMVLPGTEICLQVMAKTPGQDGSHLHFEVLNPDGRRAVSDGHAFLGQKGGPAP